MYSKTRGGKNMFLANWAWKKIGIFAGGVLFGTAGMKILASTDAKKLYTEAAAAVLRGQDCVMKVSTGIKESCEDIYADAKRINEKRAEAAENSLIEDFEEVSDFDAKEV
jgi:hypothetical protein